MKLAISTCPNDTFAFHAILNRKIDMRGLDLKIELLDIEQLNEGLLNNRFDVAKASFHAALRLAEKTIVLPSGSALGFGVGPLLLAAEDHRHPNDGGADTAAGSHSHMWPKHSVTRRADTAAGCGSHEAVTLCPGEMTTAAMLFRMFYADSIAGGKTRIEHAVFSEIMPALRNKQADFGVCIHEGRFTWQEEGLFLIEDLGTRWESETNTPLPLGGILASRSLDEKSLSTIHSLIRESIEYSLNHREETLPTMRKYAQAFSDDVLLSHVDLYVNAWTIELGETGQQALDKLSEKAKENGLVEDDCVPLEIYSPR